jgi:hypothetical protein
MNRIVVVTRAALGNALFDEIAAQLGIAVTDLQYHNILYMEVCCFQSSVTL